jgi:hypothetical protein
VLVTGEPLAGRVAGLAASDEIDIGTPVVITGMSAVDDLGHSYRYLDAEGHWGGGTIRDDQLPLGRVVTSALMRGMSGAPVLAGQPGRGRSLVVGVVSARYNSPDGWGRDSVWVARTEDLEPLLAGLGDVLMTRRSWAGPGSQIVVGEIPLQPPAFVEREILGRLAEAAEQGGVAVVCAGLRGSGKTQLAAAYARSRVNEGWALVGWVNAESREVLLAGLARVARRLGVADPAGDSIESARLLREELDTWTAPALLIFDNATDPDTLRPFLPVTGSTQVLITTADLTFAEFGQVVDVTVFNREESVTYLAARTGLEDAIGSAATAEELGDLPLGLAQAAATIRRQHLTYPAYGERLRRVPVATLLGRVPGGDYPLPVAAALLLSITAAEEDDLTELVNLVLRVLAMLSPDGVSRDLLAGLAEMQGSDQMALDGRWNSAWLGRSLRGRLPETSL